MTYTYYINLVETIINHQKFRLICRELPTVALSNHVKIREKKANIEPHENVTVPLKNA